MSMPLVKFKKQKNRMCMRVRPDLLDHGWLRITKWHPATNIVK